jgi:hypothetical protein
MRGQVSLNSLEKITTRAFLDQLRRENCDVLAVASILSLIHVQQLQQISFLAKKVLNHDRLNQS